MKDNSQYFSAHLTQLRNKTCWEHCFSPLYKNHKRVEYSSGVFHNLLENLCINHSTEMTVGFVQIILYSLMERFNALLFIKLGKKKTKPKHTNKLYSFHLFALLPLFQLFTQFRHLSLRIWRCWARTGNRGFEGRQVLAGLSWLGQAGQDTEGHHPDAEQHCQ